MLSSLLLAAVASNVAPCPGTSTLQVNSCLNARLKASDADLNRYFQAALKRIGNESGSRTARRFTQAEQSWLRFRDAECGSVFDYWRGGTIRVSMELDCRIRLTRVRTYTIWRDWLTYPDSTPPVLPRPEIQSVTSDR